jgi:hypothetical protein
MIWRSACLPQIELTGFDILCCRALFALDDIEAYGLAFGQGFEAITLNSAEMDENVPTVILFDKSKTFTLVKPFYFTF